MRLCVPAVIKERHTEKCAVPFFFQKNMKGTKKMTDNRTTAPKMMTIRQVAATGILPEHALRLMAKAGQLPAITVGETRKLLINFDRLCEQLNAL